MKRSFMMQCIRRLIKEHLFFTILLIILLIGSILLSLLPAQLLRYIIDDILKPMNRSMLLAGAAAYFVVIIAVNIVEMAKETSFVWIGQSLTQKICSEMMEKIQRIQTSYFTSVDPSLISSYFLNDAQTISSVFSSGVIAMVVNCFKIIGIIISIAMFSTTLAILLIILLPLLIAFTRLVQKKMLKVQMKSRIYTADLTKMIHDALRNARIMKVFHTQKYHVDKFENKLDETYKNNERINFYDSLYSPLTQILRAFVIVFIVFLASDYLSFSSLTIGMCAASIELMSQLFTPIEDLGNELQSIQQAVSGMKRIEDFYQLPEEKVERTLTYDMLFDKPDIELVFDHVSFAYQQDSLVLQDISFRCDQNRRNMIIGRTGVGKSTLFHLIMGFYQPTLGEITINGYHPHEIKREDMRRIFGLVDQNFVFIKGSIFDQITLRDERYSLEDVKRVMKLCGLHEKVLSFENGYDTVADESMFSKGECQLLSIARALLADPKILLLDEMSANLDSLNENRMLEVIDAISKDRLILSITHHKEILRSNDQIICLKNGKRVASLDDI
ncbi:ABC transporter ATP-binding protein [uncultured Traorella sp.]|uniref:ABC transporter ATP-binding protein n=1 Tax=uncultured Traorella sp. TaxID=1929048 RepID=UPI0025F6218D|nr:ABC transporter ATP-binding protein [uncultured Traorella sp.]